MNDFRLAFRVLARNSTPTVMALLSLGVAIGANTAVFSLVNDFLLRTLPVPNAHELVLLRNVDGADGRMSRAGENNGPPYSDARSRHAMMTLRHSPLR